MRAGEIVFAVLVMAVSEIAGVAARGLWAVLSRTRPSWALLAVLLLAGTP